MLKVVNDVQYLNVVGFSARCNGENLRHTGCYNAPRVEDMEAQENHLRLMILLRKCLYESNSEMQRISSTMTPLEETEKRIQQKRRFEMHAQRKKLIEELLILEEAINKTESET